MSLPTDNIATAYNKFQDDFGRSVEQDYSALIKSLFTENFQKIINGEVYVAKRSELLKQLADLHQAVGGWTVEVIGITPVVNSYNYASEWRIHTKNASSFHATAILGSTDGVRIDSVNEDAYKIET